VFRHAAKVICESVVVEDIQVRLVVIIVGPLGDYRFRFFHSCQALYRI
jgi:hypothetical protein